MDTAQRAMHVWLDALVEHAEHGHPTPTDDLWRSLQQVGAVNVTLDVALDEVSVDARAALDAALLIIDTAVQSWTDDTGLHRHDALSKIRYVAQQSLVNGDQSRP